jgi:hypothetical protein
MTPNQIFSIVNVVAAGAWVLLAVWPRRRWAANAIAGIAVPALLAAVYIAIIVTKWAGSAGGFSSLPAVATLFGNPWLLLAGWTHYLAFDLLIGGWEVRDARERGIPHLLVLPCLALTFLFGPAGWMLYIALRTSRLRSVPRRVQAVTHETA